MLIGLLLLSAGLIYTIMASLPLDLDEHVEEEKFYARIEIGLREPPKWPEVDVEYRAVSPFFKMVKEVCPWKVEISLYVKIPRTGDYDLAYDVQVELALVSPQGLKGVVEIDVWGLDAFSDVRKEVGSFYFRLIAQGLVEEAELLEACIKIDVVKLRAYLEREYEGFRWYMFKIYSSVSVLAKSRMEVLSYRSALVNSLGLACMALGLRRGRGKALSRKLLTGLIFSLALIVIGDILLHYAWYRIANMRVSWAVFVPIEATFLEPAPPPPSPGPWWEIWKEIRFVREFMREIGDWGLTYFPIPDELRGYSMRYINRLYGLTYLSWAFIITGLCIFLPSSAYALWVPRAEEQGLPPGRRPGAIGR